MAQWHTFPKISIVNQFYDNELMIDAFVDNAREKQPAAYDHVLFSFHGSPVRQLNDVDNSGMHNCDTSSCRTQLTATNKFCYTAQCHETARLIAAKLDLKNTGYTVCFQSRLGKNPWVQPYTSDVLIELAAKGVKRLLVLCPAFVADCLETLYEVTEEYGLEFKKLGGEHVELVPSLNDHPKWIAALKEMVLTHEREDAAVQV